MAKTKAAGSTKLGRDSESKRLGVKLFAGEKARVGNVLVRQRGSKFVAGRNVKKGNDDTLYAIKEGLVKFTDKKIGRFDGKRRSVKVVNVE
jgi:large subunit ribosomal protein L27